MAKLVLLVLPVLKATKALQVHVVPLATLVPEVARVTRETLALLANPDYLVTAALRVSRVQLAHAVHSENVALLDQRVTPVLSELLDVWVLRDQRETKETLVCRDLPVHLDLRALVATKVLKVTRVQLVLLVLEASVV